MTIRELKEALNDYNEDLSVVVTTDAAAGRDYEISDISYESHGPCLLLVFEREEFGEPEEDDDDPEIICPHCGKEV